MEVWLKVYAGRFLPTLLASEMPPRHFFVVLEVPVKVILADPFGNVYVGVKDLAIVRLLDRYHGEHPRQYPFYRELPLFLFIYAIWATGCTHLTLVVIVPFLMS